jgi:uncharacterized protein
MYLTTSSRRLRRAADEPGSGAGYHDDKVEHIETRSDLRGRYAAPVDRVVQKELDHLDVHCRRFIAKSPFLVLATSDAAGDVDASPRGGDPGFVAVPDDHTLLIPDRPGNNRLDSLTNLTSNPGVALIFFIPGVDETLRVNGTAHIDASAERRQHFAVGSRLPATVLRVDVRQAYLHCAKALMRSRLWDPDARVDRAELPTMGEMIRDHIASSDPPETQDAMLERFRDSLY